MTPGFNAVFDHDVIKVLHTINIFNLGFNFNYQNNL